MNGLSLSHLNTHDLFPHCLYIMECLLTGNGIYNDESLSIFNVQIPHG